MAEGVPNTAGLSGSTSIFQDDLDFAFECALDYQKNKSKEGGVSKENIETLSKEKGRAVGVESSQSSLLSDLPDSDIDEVIAESSEIISRERKVTIKSDFFLVQNTLSGRNSVSGESMTYDPTPPSRNQVIGSTPEYLEYLKAQPESIGQLVPIFTLEELNKPCNMYWNYPRAVIDYNMFEKSMVPIIPNGAVKKLICKEGRDEKLAAGDNVLINYYIYVEGIPNCVESNKRRRKPHSFVLGKKRGGIPVIDLGTLSMRVKEVAAFLATPEYGYGKMGTGDNRISPNKRVLCIIEVLSRLASPLDSSSIINLVPAERKLLGFEEIYEFAMKRKNDANKDLANDKNARAMRKYLQAVTCLQDAIPKCDLQQEKKIDLFHILYGNIAKCGIRTGQMDVVVEFSQKSIELPIPEEDKAYDYFQCAKAYYCDKKWTKAKSYIDTALQLLQGSDAEKDARKLWNYIESELSKLEKIESASSTGSTSTLSTTESSEAQAKEKKKRSSICGGLIRRLSESSSK